MKSINFIVLETFLEPKNASQIKKLEEPSFCFLIHF